MGRRVYLDVGYTDNWNHAIVVDAGLQVVGLLQPVEWSPLPRGHFKPQYRGYNTYGVVDLRRTGSTAFVAYVIDPGTRQPVCAITL